MLTNITLALTNVITWVGNVVSSLVSAEGALAPLLPVVAISIAIGVLGFGIRTIKSLVWGI